MKKIKKKYIAGILLGLLLIVGLSYAWFSRSRNIAAMGRIHAPTELTIKAGHTHDAAELYLGSINVNENLDSNGIHHKYYIFSVCGSKGMEYYLQLGYTTNIPLEYYIYAAEETEAQTEYVFKALDNTTYYYNKLSNIPLTERFKHEDEFEEVEKKQVNADPVYQQTSSSLILPDEGYMYFVLEVTWKQSDVDENKIANDKETDLIYLIAGTPESD